MFCRDRSDGDRARADARLILIDVLEREIGGEVSRHRPIEGIQIEGT